MPKRKVTLYFRDDVLAETQREAVRQDRSISWIIQAAWKIARGELKATLPELDEPDPGDPSPDVAPRQAHEAASAKPSLSARAVSPRPTAPGNVAVATRQATGKG